MKFFKKIFFSFAIFGIFFWNFSPVFSQNIQISGAKISSNGEAISSAKKIEIIQKIFFSPQFPFSYSGLSIFIDTNQKEPRWQIRGKEMKLSAHIASDSEFLKLFIHELGHFVDIYFLRAYRNFSDPSREFYKISWQSPKVKHANSSLENFVSGYAATNQYEDFAESFVWYIFHNNDFFDAALKNEILRQKYLFFSDYVFTSEQFIGTDFSAEKIPSYRWDTTKIPIIFENYLNFIQ